MIVEYIRYRIETARTEEFLGAYDVAQASLQQSPHCLGYELTRCTEAPEHFTLRIEWDSAEGHLQGFRKSPGFGPFLAAVRPFVPSIEEMRHYAPTPLRWARGEGAR
ncbi:MAG: antibiotic biosynthesis monooxygenase [Myxococcales bacterium]|nr:MAG: antibiotic biosynthesis monooxygenase [Myxococcales bacterium]